MEHADSVVIMKKLMQTKEIAILNSVMLVSILRRMLYAEDVPNIKDYQEIKESAKSSLVVLMKY